MADTDKTPAPQDSSRLEKRLAATSTPQDLAAQVIALRARVEILEGQVDTWKKRAAKHQSRLQKVTAKAEQAIAEATAAAKKRAKAKAEKKIQQVIADHARADHPRAEPLALKDAPELPQASWTVARLRVAAKEQGVPGYARMRKEQLLDALI